MDLKIFKEKILRNKKIPENPLYFMMNKNFGTVCSKVSDRRKTVYENFSSEELVSKEKANLHTIGRLDCDTVGLLFFTNDGKLSNFLTRPENKIQKEYFVVLKDEFSIQQKNEFSDKALKGGIILPAEKKANEQKSGNSIINWNVENDFILKVRKMYGFTESDERFKSSKCCFITVTEGKFHEVKRIFCSFGTEVVFLMRTKMAGIELDYSLKSGEKRQLGEKEVLALKSLFLNN